MIGKTLGHFRIVEKIGAGGMGEVYRGRDARLDRDVAIKVLPSHLAEDAAALARFEREAKAIATLSHPNILGIFDVGSEGGIAYAVTELLEGETLRERVQEGAFPVRRAIDCAIQIAHGLAAAHDKGIIHRDLKPENVFLLKDGQVKILDFGLARQLKPTNAEATASAALTSPGTVMGTTGYMSPEQVRGREVDHRSDIFNLGLVLYELLSGRRAFYGETSVDTMQGILRADPPELPETIPGGVRQIVAHCLEKDLVNRFQSARDLGFALTALSQSGSQIAAIPTPARRSSWLMRGAAVLGIVTIVVVAVLIVRRTSPTPAAPEWKGTLLGGPEIAFGPRISPDGSWLAFQAMVAGQSQVAVMKPDSADFRVLTTNSNAGSVMEVCWAPDGNGIYYDRSHDVPLGIYRVPVTGGREQLVQPNAMFPQTLPDGSLLAVHLNAEQKYQVFRFWPDTGRTKEFPVEVLNYPVRIRAFPDRYEAIVTGNLLESGHGSKQHLYVIELESGRLRRLTTGLPESEEPLGALAVARDGKSVLAVHSSGAFHRIMEIRRDGNSPTRTLLSLTRGVEYLDLGPDGSIYFDQKENPMDWLRFPLTGGQPKRIATFPYGTTTGYAPAGGGFFASLPDGASLMPLPSGSGTSVMVVDSTGQKSSLTSSAEQTSSPIALAGPDLVACLIGTESHREIALVRISTRTILGRIPVDIGTITSLASSPDGRTLYCGAGGTIWEISASGGKPKKIRAGNFVAADSAGRFLIVQAVEASRSHLFRVPLPGGQEEEIGLNLPFGINPYSGINSQSLRGNRLLVSLTLPSSWFFSPGVIDLATGSITRIPLDYFGDVHYLGWTPDGQITAAVFGLRSSLWKFQPQSRKD